MAKIFFRNLIVLLFFYHVQCYDSEQCYQESSCVCQVKNDKKIDISKLIDDDESKKDHRFLEADKFNFRFFFHGCTDAKFKPIDYNIPLTDDIKNTTELEGSLIVYQYWFVNNTELHGNLTVLGHDHQISYRILPKSEPYELIYENKTDGKIIASFRLICENYEKPYIAVIDDPQNKEFTLNSVHACLEKETERTSFGSEFLITLLIICLVYIVGGGCFLYFARGARGAELIPNIDFWKSLPGLVKDGTLFLFGGCNASYISSSAEAYDRI